MTPASNRTELDRHMEQIKPALIILDLQLSEDDGLDFEGSGPFDTSNAMIAIVLPRFEMTP